MLPQTPVFSPSVCPFPFGKPSQSGIQQWHSFFNHWMSYKDVSNKGVQWLHGAFMGWKTKKKRQRWMFLLGKPPVNISLQFLGNHSLV